MKKRGGQTVLTENEEKLLVSRLQICSDWGYPIDLITLRLLVKDFIDRQGKIVAKFKNNLPGHDFVLHFLKRYIKELSSRMCQNIKRSRAAISRDTINEYFDHLQVELKDVPPKNIMNYDETNLCDDPGKRQIIVRRGCKYPERIINSTKASISVMFAATADGTIMPPYVVYKAQHIYDSWRVGGPPNSRYNRTKSGWFDAYCFQDWIETIAIPHLSKFEGKKVLIGDNLASRLSLETIRKCQEEDIKFVLLPANSTHLTQPLDVAFFRPLKGAWRSILEKWKKGPGRSESSLPNDKFPPLLKELCSSVKESNVIAGFNKCGIVPFNRNHVLDIIPSAKSSAENGVSEEVAEALDDSFKEYLEGFRKQDVPHPRKRRTKVSVLPGKSVSVTDFASDETAGPSGVGGPVPSPVLKRRKRKTPVRESSTSEDSDEYSLQDSDNEWRENFSDNEQFPEISDSTEEAHPLKLSLGEFSIVKVMGKTKNTFRLYVAKVTEFDEEGYIGQFFKKSTHGFKFSVTEEEALFKVEDIVLKLSSAKKCSSSRFKDYVEFENDLSAFSLH